MIGRRDSCVILAGQSEIQRFYVESAFRVSFWENCVGLYRLWPVPACISPFPVLSSCGTHTPVTLPVRATDACALYLRLLQVTSFVTCTKEVLANAAHKRPRLHWVFYNLKLAPPVVTFVLFFSFVCLFVWGQSLAL